MNGQMLMNWIKNHITKTGTTRAVDLNQPFDVDEMTLAELERYCQRNGDTNLRAFSQKTGVEVREVCPHLVFEGMEKRGNEWVDVFSDGYQVVYMDGSTAYGYAGNTLRVVIA